MSPPLAESAPRGNPAAALPAWWPWALAALLTALRHAWLDRVGIGLQDEGFLWYGAQRTLAGEVPLRDFQAYEPARYYWCALWAPLVGSGLVGLRLAVALFHGLGLALGLDAARRVVRGPAALVALALALELWAFPPHKLFESAATMALVRVALALVESPRLRVHVLAGVAVGLAGWLGRNHGLYGSVAFAGLLALLAWKDPARRGVARPLAWAGGVALGLAPFLAMVAFVPGYGRSLADALLVNVRQGTNLPWPAPWPWTVDFEHLPAHEAWATFAVGASFVLLFVVYGAGLVIALRAGARGLRERALLIAATVVGIPYAHHASVRSDAWHLAQVVPPMLLGFAALVEGVPRLPRAARATAWVMLTVTSFLAASLWNRPLAARLPLGARVELVEREVAGERLLLPALDAHYLDTVEAVLARHVPPDAPLLVAPNRPALYAILGRRSPVWGSYLLLGADEATQRAMLRDLERVDWALVTDYAPDGREELAFAHAYPLVQAELEERFAPVDDPELPPGHALLRRR